MNTNSKMTRRASGFTTFELLAVVVLVGIFASLAFPRFMDARDRGYVGAAHYDLTAIRQILALYAADQSRYPEALSSYEDLVEAVTKSEGTAEIVMPSGRTFEWVSYQVTRDGEYILRIQALDHEGTVLKATADRVTLES